MAESPAAVTASNRFHERYKPLNTAIQQMASMVEISQQAIDRNTGPDATLPDLCRLYDAVRNTHEALEEVTKALSKQVQLLAVTILPRRFADAQTSTLTLKDLGARFVVQTRTNASMVDKEKAIEWLKETGGQSLVQQTVNSSTLAKFATEYVVEHGRDLPADLFKVSTIQHMSRTRV